MNPPTIIKSMDNIQLISPALEQKPIDHLFCLFILNVFEAEVRFFLFFPYRFEFVLF